MVLVIYILLVEGAARRPVSWSELVTVMSRTGYLSVFIAGTLLQIVFAIIAAIG